jgi:hypothetical protein
VWKRGIWINMGGREGEKDSVSGRERQTEKLGQRRRRIELEKRTIPIRQGTKLCSCTNKMFSFSKNGFSNINFSEEEMNQPEQVTTG